MSEMLDALNAAGGALVDGPAMAVVDELLEKTEAEAERGLPDELRPAAAEAIDALGDPAVKDAAAKLTKGAMARLLANFVDGDKREARRVYMATEATTRERIEFQNAAGDAAELLEAQRAREWEAIEAALEKIGTIAIKALTTLFLGALGL